LQGEESKTWKKDANKHYSTKTFIKRVASLSLLEVGGLVAKPQPPVANGAEPPALGNILIKILSY